MALKFGFAFLAPKHSYVASVTEVSDSGYLIHSSQTACFRVPVSFTKGYETSAQTRYISDIHGHDFLSHTGRWASEDARGISKKSENIINEIGGLRALGRKLEERGYNKADLRLSLGPQPGSFFADVKKLKLYRWEKVPTDLNNTLQDELARRGYGKISNVAMNAAGGWVMHFHEVAALGRVFRGRNHPPQFCWGGEAALPSALVAALQSGRERGAKISHIFLNHQSQHEYLLLFNDGYSYANLHFDFQKSIKRLVDMWVTRTLNKHLNWNFTYSCQCLDFQQKQVDAAYYNCRGRFYILKSANNPGSPCQDIDLALDYLGEAITQDPKSREIRHSQRIALVAARRIKNDTELEANIAESQRRGVPQISLINPRDSTPAGIFRNQYLQLINSEEDCLNLERQLNQLNPSVTEWSYGINRFSIETEFVGDDDEYRNSTAMTPIEMLGSIPSVNSNQEVLAQREAIEQSDEQNVTAESQRRLSELGDEQVIPTQRRASVFSYVQSFAAQRRSSVFSREQNDPPQRRASGLSSEWSDATQRTSSIISTEQNPNTQRRASELGSDQISTARRRPSRVSLEQTATAQTEVQRRESGFSSPQSPTSQRETSELAGDEYPIPQRISEPWPTTETLDLT